MINQQIEYVPTFSFTEFPVNIRLIINSISFPLLTIGMEKNFIGERKISSRGTCDIFIYSSISPIISIYVFSNVLCCLYIIIIIFIEIFIFLYFWIITFMCFIKYSFVFILHWYEFDKNFLWRKKLLCYYRDKNC